MNGDSNKVMCRLHDDILTAQSLGHNVFGVFLQGSQNYNLDYDGSDIDTKVIVLPSFEDIVLNRQPVSTTHVREDNTHIDLKDIRLMWQCFKKQNINFLEILFTDFYIVNNQYKDLWYDMRYRAEDIAHYNNYAAVNCIAGMVFEKHAALCHPYPTLKAKIDKHGYDNKQLHHIVRCKEFLERYIKGVSYKDCLIPTNPAELIEIKSEYKLSLEEAKRVADCCKADVKAIKEHYMNTHPVKVREDVAEFMQDILVEALKRSLRAEIWK